QRIVDAPADVPTEVDIDAHVVRMIAVDGEGVISDAAICPWKKSDIGSDGVEAGARPFTVPSDRLADPIAPLVRAEGHALVPPVWRGIPLAPRESHHGSWRRSSIHVASLVAASESARRRSDLP